MRKAALAIGVSSAPPLPHLGGAVNGARGFHEWATALGYASSLVTDELELVTTERVRKELEALLADGATHRLLVYFAGHGIIREAEEGLWLLSDWYKDLRAVAVEALKRRLYRYQVGQIAFFADACRSLPADVETADLVPEAVLGRGPAERSPAAIDKFIAAQDGTPTFMIPGPNPDDDRCLFSGVLLEGLWGTNPAAFSKHVPGKVTSHSLGRYLQSAVPALAGRYELKVEPTVLASFPEDDDVYFGDGPPVIAPTFPPWPPPEEVAARRPRPSGPTREMVFAPPDRGRLLGNALRQQDAPGWFETGAGFAIDGADVLAVWTPREVSAAAGERPGWWQIGSKRDTWLQTPAAVLVELATGPVACATAVPEFIATGLIEDQGVVAWVYREVYAGPEVASATEAALARLEGRGIRADDGLDLAVELRQGKHADPVRGVLAAYLYDAIGDVDSIRRMAFAYIDHYQSIPYDIALLSQLSSRLRPDGLFEVIVPPVAASEPRTPTEAAVAWTHEATPQSEGVVAGHWPWLRQGWSFLDDPDPAGTTLVLPGVAELAGELMAARFTTLNNAAGLRLAELMRLSRTGH